MNFQSQVIGLGYAPYTIQLKSAKVKAMDLMWKHGLASGVGLGSYDIQINLP